MELTISSLFFFLDKYGTISSFKKWILHIIKTIYKNCGPVDELKKYVPFLPNNNNTPSILQ